MDISDANIKFAVNSCKSILFIVIFISLFISYSMSFHINSTLLINKICGDDVIEMNTLRNKALYFKKIYFMPIIIILLIIILVLFAIILINYKGVVSNIDIVVYITISIILLINIFINGRPYNFFKERDFNKYSTIFDSIVCEIIGIFSKRKNGLKFNDSLRTIFPQNVLDELVSRWKHLKTAEYREFNTHSEIIYTDNDFIDEIDALLSNIEYTCDDIENKHKDTTVEKTIKSIKETDKCVRLFIGLLSPEKRELTFIHDAYKKWTKKNEAQLGDKYQKACTQLPRLEDYTEINVRVKSRSDMFLYICWVVIALIALYTFYEYRKNTEQIGISMIASILRSIVIYAIFFR